MVCVSVHVVLSGFEEFCLAGFAFGGSIRNTRGGGKTW